MPPLSDQAVAAASMRLYRDLGLNPLPSRDDKKAPRVAYARYWDRPGPPAWLDIPTRNIQVMTGRRWNLAVIDLDGPMALDVFAAWTLHRTLPPTWQVARDPSAGRHLWFRLPPNAVECRSRDLWELAGTKHNKIELKADRSLIIAPPSVHVKTGQRYVWLPGCSPSDLDRPAIIPDWLLSIPGISSLVSPVTFASLPPAAARTVSNDSPRYDRRKVAEAIGDKLSLAVSWGLRPATDRPTSDGWLRCHVINREDRDPSASFHVRSGNYVDFASKSKLRFFDLGVASGVYLTWQDAVNDLGARFNAPL